MRTLLIFMCLLMGTMFAQAQQSVSYAYDNNGNRVGRTIVLQKTAQELIEEGDLQNNDNLKVGDQLNALYDQMTGFSIRIFPNPTKGKLFIEADAATEQLGLYLTDTKGHLIYSVNPESEVAYPLTIDLSNYSSGIYYLRFVSGEESRSWKIIKQ
ncbi:MAG: T9SS type A sorting domain-containing protein [Lentimicrobiaceae bacterium]|nr:T9SS type A sorting domain-containing protein [Lentimicrobiaceae bacterium]